MTDDCAVASPSTAPLQLWPLQQGLQPVPQVRHQLAAWMKSNPRECRLIPSCSLQKPLCLQLRLALNNLHHTLQFQSRAFLARGAPLGWQQPWPAVQHARVRKICREASHVSAQLIRAHGKFAVLSHPHSPPDVPLVSTQGAKVPMHGPRPPLKKEKYWWCGDADHGNCSFADQRAQPDLLFGHIFAESSRA